MKFTILCIALFIFQNDCIILSKEEINLLNERSYIVVQDSTGKVFGSGGDITPRPLYIYFDYFKFFPSTKEIEVKGGGATILTSTDTIWDKNLRIFKARNSNDTLYAAEYLHTRKINPVNGKFRFKTTIDSLKHFYIVGGYTRVYEYNVSKLLTMKWP